jgi:hypothetical protein
MLPCSRDTDQLIDNLCHTSINFNVESAVPGLMLLGYDGGHSVTCDREIDIGN